MKKYFILLISLLFFISQSYSQVGMGKWRTHFSYNNSTQIEQSDNKVFVVSEGTLFSIQKNDGSIQFYSKITGLSGAVISKIAYDDTNKILLITYEDGNIDFLTSDGVKNLPDFYYKQISGDKTANHILFHNNKAYLSTSFGILVLNMTKMEIADTYYIGNNASEVFVNNIAIHQDNIYATTSNAIFEAAINSNELINYENWKSVNSLPGTGKYESIYSFDENLILLRSGKLYKRDINNNWSSISPEINFTKIIKSEDYLQAYSNNQVYLFDRNFNMQKLTALSRTIAGVYDAKNKKFWFIGDEKGVAEYDLKKPSEINFYTPEGPIVNSPYNMFFAGEKLFIVPGAKWIGPELVPGNIMIYENNKWTNIPQATIEKSLNNIRVEDFTSIVVDPEDSNHFFTTSASTGLYEFRNNELYKHHDKDNSKIETVIDPNNYYGHWIDNATIDNKGNVWITNDLAIKGIKIYTKAEEWLELGFESINRQVSLGKIVISDKNPNQKWLIIKRNSPGICIFDDNGTINDQSDDRSIFYDSFKYSTSNGTMSISPNIYFCMEQDANGAIWVGTNQGPLVFNDPSKAFDSNFSASRIIIPKNDGTGLGDFLLEDQEIRAIAIDGANRKWIGTTYSGVYLMSENGQETIHHFTTKNSPLTSNNVMSIAINPVSGEVFFGTGSGLFSYQSDAAKANSVFNNVHAYPNPVRENFDGVITIKGLVKDTQVKILDTAGNLVAETTSKGDIATWDAKNKLGDKVSTGVYLIICLSPDGEQSEQTKILVIK